MAENIPPWLIVVAIILGSGGVAALGGVITTFIKDRRSAGTEERSVTIDEIEKGIPGLGQIITELRAHNAGQAADLERQRGDIERLERRIDQLERELEQRRRT